MGIHIVAGTEDLFATVFDNRSKMLHSYKDKIRAGSSVLSEMQFEHNKWLESFKQMCINYAHGMGCYNDVILADFKRVVGKYVSKSQIPREGDFDCKISHHILLRGHGSVPTNLENMVILCAGTSMLHEIDMLFPVSGVMCAVQASIEILHGGDDSITLMTTVTRWDALTSNQQMYYQRHLDRLA